MVNAALVGWVLLILTCASWGALMAQGRNSTGMGVACGGCAVALAIVVAWGPA